MSEEDGQYYQCRVESYVIKYNYGHFKEILYLHVPSILTQFNLIIVLRAPSNQLQSLCYVWIARIWYTVVSFALYLQTDSLREHFNKHFNTPYPALHQTVGNSQIVLTFHVCCQTPLPNTSCISGLSMS